MCYNKKLGEGGRQTVCLVRSFKRVGFDCVSLSCLNVQKCVLCRRRIALFAPENKGGAKTKKILSLALALVMCLSIGAGAPARASGPVQISTAEELIAFAKRVNNGEYSLDAVLTADIQLSIYAWKESIAAFDQKVPFTSRATPAPLTALDTRFKPAFPITASSAKSTPAAWSRT